MKIAIYVELDDADEYADSEHEMGISDAGYERLTGSDQPLGWLGEVIDVEKVA